MLGRYLQSVNGLGDYGIPGYETTGWILYVDGSVPPGVPHGDVTVADGMDLLFCFTGVRGVTVSFNIENTVAPVGPDVPWSGVLTEYMNTEISVTHGDTVLDAFYNFAYRENINVETAAGPYGYSIRSIEGLGRVIPEQYKYIGWAYSVNGRYDPEVGMEMRTVSDGDVYDIFLTKVDWDPPADPTPDPTPTPAPAATSTASAESKSVKIVLENTHLPAGPNVPWTGILNKDKPQTVKSKPEATIADCLSAYAKEQGYELSFNEGSYKSVKAINGLGAGEIPNYQTSWMVKLNGEILSAEQAASKIPEDGAELVFYFTGRLPGVAVSFVNQEFTDGERAAWSGELPPASPETAQVPLPLPAKDVYYAKDILEKYAEINKFKLSFTADGSKILAIEGLSSDEEMPGKMTAVWQVLHNDQLVKEALSLHPIKPGDRLRAEFKLYADLKVDFSALEKYRAFWPCGRGSPGNRAVREKLSETPLPPAALSPAWLFKAEDGSAETSWGEPIVVNDKIFAVRGRSLEIIDCRSGRAEKSIPLSADQGGAVSAPLYADGLIFVPLAEGSIECFRADTQESLWLVQDAAGGRPLSQIAYHDGILYVPFGTDEGKKASLMAIDVQSAGILWQESLEKGFCGAGGIPAGHFYVGGAEDGLIKVRERKSGRVTDTYDFKEPIRSSVVSDGRMLYAVNIKGEVLRFRLNSAGRIEEQGLLDLGMPVKGDILPHGDRLYAGGDGVFKVLDLDSGDVVREIRLDGAAEGTPLLVLGDKNERYIYFTVNNGGGGLYYFKDSPGKKGKGRAELLYKPEAEFAGGASSSPIMLPGGALLYSNDSGTLFALKAEGLAEDLQKTSAGASDEGRPSAPLSGGNENGQLLQRIPLPVRIIFPVLLAAGLAAGITFAVIYSRRRRD